MRQSRMAAHLCAVYFKLSHLSYANTVNFADRRRLAHGTIKKSNNTIGKDHIFILHSFFLDCQGAVVLYCFSVLLANLRGVIPLTFLKTVEK